MDYIHQCNEDNGDDLDDHPIKNLKTDGYGMVHSTFL
jgi:hypothetical protein